MNAPALLRARRPPRAGTTRTRGRRACRPGRARAARRRRARVARSTSASRVGPEQVAGRGLDQHRRQAREVGDERVDDGSSGGWPSQVGVAKRARAARASRAPGRPRRRGSRRRSRSTPGHRNTAPAGQRQRPARCSVSISEHASPAPAESPASTIRSAPRCVEQPAVRAERVLDRGRERMLGREPVVGHQHAGARRRDQRAGQRPVAVGRADDVAAAVQVEDRRARSPSAGVSASAETPPALTGRTATPSGTGELREERLVGRAHLLRCRGRR